MGFTTPVEIPRKYLNLFFLPVLLFIILYSVLSFHSRLMGDDFFYIWLENHFGAWKGMIYQYDAWSGRWSAHLTGCLLLSYRGNIFFLPAINLVTLFALIFGVRMSVKKISNSFGIKLNSNKSFLLSFFFIISFFFLSYDNGETWFWYIIIITYLWSLIVFIFLLNAIYSDKSHFFSCFIIFLSSAFIGGASESFALIFICVLLLLLSFRIVILKKRFFEIVNSKIMYALIFLGVSFAFAVLSPGTAIRHSLLPETNFIDKIIITVKSFTKYFVRYLPSKIIFILLFSSPWMLAGIYLPNAIINSFRSKNLFLKITFIFLLLLMLVFAPTSFVMSETGPARALSIVSFLSAIYFSFVFLSIGKIFSTTLIKIPLLVGLMVLIDSAFLIVMIFDQYVTTKNFAEAYESRMKTINNAVQNNFNGTLKLQPLPDPGMLYKDDISADSNYFTNKHMKDGLDLPFNIKLENK